MTYQRILLICLIFTCCLSCQDEADKRIALKAKKIDSVKPLIQDINTEKEKLLDYDFFKLPLANLEPTDLVVLYDLNTPLFSNYVFKKRFVYLSDSTKIS